MKHSTPRQQKFAAVYDAEVWPLVPERAAELILRQLPRSPTATVLDLGSATGKLALAIADRLDGDSRVLGIDASPALVELADTAQRAHPTRAQVSFRVADLTPPWPVDGGAHDLAISNLVLGETPDPRAAVSDLARVLKPGGRAVITVPLRGCWTEFLDLYADVLTEQGKRDGLAALRAYQASLPDADTAVNWLESAGLEGVTIGVSRWDLLFKSAREFFFAPIIEFGPLPIWKEIAGGRGDEMQDVFFFVKEAIETYFSGSSFSVGMVIGCFQGRKPIDPLPSK
jgi:SAM-dependent methyltransferase